jgi:alpha-1,3-rhamnosyl/mannosyltransferase
VQHERLLALAPGTIEVIPPAISPAFCPSQDPERDREIASRLGASEPFVLHVGALEPRKNLGRVLDSLDALPGELARGLRLVVVASAGWHDHEIRRRLEPSVGSGRVVVVGDLTEEELAAVYRTAEAMVYPSLAEGFGLPVVEAMACGTPVVTSDRSAMREVAGGAAVLVDPDDPEAIADGVARAVADAETRRRLVAAGLERSRRFAPERVIPQMLALYRRLAGG